MRRTENCHEQKNKWLPDSRTDFPARSRRSSQDTEAPDAADSATVLSDDLTVSFRSKQPLILIFSPSEGEKRTNITRRLESTERRVAFGECARLGRSQPRPRGWHGATCCGTGSQEPRRRRRLPPHRGSQQARARALPMGRYQQRPM